MTPPTSTAVAVPGNDLAEKIGRLVEEKGWNQEDFARISNLNRHTVRQILNGGPKRRLRNATVSQCADAFDLTVHELRTLSLDRLLMRVHGKGPVDEEAQRLLAEGVTLAELASWLERNAPRKMELRADEITELLEMQAPGGPLERFGVEHVIDTIERRRKLLCQVRTIATSEYLELIEQFVGLIFEKVTAGKPRTDPRGR
jgi:transcriptional regulator with XRE-family HTH domain